MLTATKLNEFLSDTRWHDNWMQRADRDVRYFDGDQIDSETWARMRDRGFAPLVRNYIRPTVNLLLGTEAKNRRDFKVSADDEASAKVAEALQQELKSAERSSGADRACSDALASMLKSGIGWVGVTRNPDPFGPPLKATCIHRNEMRFDWRARESDLSDSRFLIRQRWHDVDTLVSWFPKHKNVIPKLTDQRAKWDVARWDMDDEESLSQFSYFIDGSNQFTTERWVDSERKRLRLYEVWYKEWIDGFVLRLPNGRVQEFDNANINQAMLVALGRAKLEKSNFMKVRRAYFIGPYKLIDAPSPYPHAHFPYVPFIADRKDSIGEPIGLVYHMISPQDEINARLSKMMWLLSQKRVISDSDAFHGSPADIAQEAARPDAVFLLNPHRKNKTSDAFRVETDTPLSQQQFQVLLNATQSLQDTAGVYQAQLGKEGVADSGVAISSLVEQGATTSADMMDNFRYSHTRVGELLLSLVRENLEDGEHEVSINYNGTKKTIGLNKRGTREDGTPIMQNSVAQARLTIGLEDIPQTASYKQQQFTMLVEMIKSLPPDVIPLFADVIVKTSDLPQTDRDMLVQRIQNSLGLPKEPEDMTPEEIQAAQKDAQLQEQMKQLAVEKEAADVQSINAKIEEVMARAEELRAQAARLQQETIIDTDKHDLEVLVAKDDSRQKERELDIKEDELEIKRKTANKTVTKPASK